jgi:hypothetical protein
MFAFEMHPTQEELTLSPPWGMPPSSLLLHIVMGSPILLLLLLNWVGVTPDRPLTSSSSSSQTREET